MEEKITPEQKEQLNNWSIQRDALLGVIAGLKTEEEKRTNRVKDLAISATELENKIQQSIGRLEELDKVELLYMEIVDSKLPDLETQKTKLETLVTILEKEAGGLLDKKEEIKKDIEFLTKVQSEIFKRTGILEEVVEHVTKVSASNIKELDEVVASLTKKVKEVIALSTEDIEAQNRILGEIPKLFVELQRKVLLRNELKKVK